ncbi:MAG TPA: response regulator, partial [Acidimicrobiales bacterium]|nr:response regulator [Acidimicrobiales bacterium]
MDRVAGPHVIIVEDHRVLAEGLAGVLAARGFSTEAITGNGVADLSRLLAVVHGAPTARPVVLIDLRLGDGLDGSTFVAPLVDHGAAVLVLTGWSTDLQAARCLASGALGVLRKSLSVEEL